MTHFEDLATTLAQRALHLTDRLIDTTGPRPSGSPASSQAADALQAEAEGFADRAWTEDFAVHPGAFLGWIRLLVMIYLAGVVLLWLDVFWLAALLATAGLVLLVGQFFFYYELLDPLFPKQTGRNVLAAVEPQGEVRGQLIVSGHHDSARIFNFLANRPALYPWRVTGGLAIYALFLAACWVLTIWTLLAGAPGWSTASAVLFSVVDPVHAGRWRQPGLDRGRLGDLALPCRRKGGRTRAASPAGGRR